MSLIHWQPLKELEALRHQMNQVFDAWLHPDPEARSLSPIDGMAWTPAIELHETDTDVVLKAEVPGIEAKDLDVQVSEHTISISGHHQEETRTEEKGVFRSELRYGQFQRLIPLPTPVQYDQVKADFKNGILTLTLPKIESARKPVVKVNLEEKLREATTQQRQAKEHQEQNVHRRAEDALETMQMGDLDQATRETLTQERHQNEQRQESAHLRANQ
ncbi:Hsp20/alpha crystallin family protein [Leptolyngbya sp. FACHB-17]|uniref:Hsp20/alpha crystallin family protein n=1 Tax=unclassified Leptolyngbya TaxID=2650499 RepID=UPI00167FE96C|nr:Hsp20/alpha crystallin family protein [Leptolyngbya sp. FACHB-17]MBD2078382.1 Hsp20/alpha crystallin family protein [Leptolyngbya sp. FACHB-17]